MKVLYVDHNTIATEVMEVAGTLRNVEIDGRFLPGEIYKDAEHRFAGEQGLVELCRGYDGAIFDCETFGHSRIRGGQGSQLPRYLTAVVDAGYEGPIIVTTISKREVEGTFPPSLMPRISVVEKPFDLDEMFAALERTKS